MNNGVEVYLATLKAELSTSDPATVQDALSDAEEYLRTGLDQLLRERPELDKRDALQQVIDGYGSPAEVASAYRQIEAKITPPLSPSKPANGRSWASRFFGVFVDPSAYGALFYMIFSLATGIMYFTWAVTGLSMSAGFIILIIGLPFFALFLLSVQGIALVEGRIVEALLGVRMPRRPVFSKTHLGPWERIKALFTDKRSWFTIIYMVLQLPLGIFYFTLFVTMISFGLAGIAMPIVQFGFGLPIGIIGDHSFYAPIWLVPLFVFTGVLWLLLTMHLAKALGRLHGAFAKVMLVKE